MEIAINFSKKIMTCMDKSFTINIFHKKKRFPLSSIGWKRKIIPFQTHGQASIAVLWLSVIGIIKILSAFTHNHVLPDLFLCPYNK